MQHLDAMKNETSQLFSNLQCYLQPIGMEVGLCKVEWYNEHVGPRFKFELPKDTICAVIITAPRFFEDAFIPFVKDNFEELEHENKGFVDKCVASHIEKIAGECSSYKPLCMFDYEQLPDRRPKVLVQTAAHVSGIAYYYQQKDLKATEETKKLYGVCVHPDYGGWFSIRCVIVFTELQDESLCYKAPVDCVPTFDLRLELLQKLNRDWKDYSWRDVITVKEKYSPIQIKFFHMLPKNRGPLLKELLDC